MLVNLNDVLIDAQKNKYGVGLFNTIDTDMLEGAISDRFGRKIILISSLFGSAIGYYLFGFGGALWILFLGRIIEGLTGGEISAILAYFADLTPIESRTKYFGWISATVGIGTAAGPLIGGFLAQYGPAIHLYVASFLSLSNAVYGYFNLLKNLISVIIY